MGPTEKRVTFVEKRNTTMLLEDVRDPSDSGCRRGLIRLRRNSLMKQSMTLRKAGYGILLRDSFGDYSDTITQQNLNAFVQSPDCRGLERYLSSQHDEDRQDVRDGVMRAVLVGQRVLKGRGKTPDKIAECIAQRVQKLSQEARVFARRVGVADALAATKEDDETLQLASNLVRNLNQGNARYTARRPSFQEDCLKCSSLDCSSAPNQPSPKGTRKFTGQDKLTPPSSPIALLVKMDSTADDIDSKDTCISMRKQHESQLRVARMA